MFFFFCRLALYFCQFCLFMMFSLYLSRPSLQRYERLSLRPFNVVTLIFLILVFSASFCFSSEWGKHNGGGSGRSLWLRHWWKGELLLLLQLRLFSLRWEGKQPRWLCCLCPQLPMVLKVPRLNSSPLALCDRPFSLLGFGDILVPGGSFFSLSLLSSFSLHCLQGFSNWPVSPQSTCWGYSHLQLHQVPAQYL